MTGCDARPQYIEMIEFYPVEYYTPGSPVTAAAYYARYGGETQTVYNPDLGSVVTITVQRPMTVQYGYGIPGTYGECADHVNIYLYGHGDKYLHFVRPAVRVVYHRQGQSLL
jgi:hypothetical protein